MTVKPGVSMKGISPAVVGGMLVAYSVYFRAGKALRITSITEGQHMEGSLHPRGYAFDVGLVGGDKKVAAQLRLALGAEWDVVLEKDHIHVEFDPK